MPSRYGTGELYGFDFSILTPERIRELSRANHKSIVCPFRPKEKGKSAPKCNKKGGVCSLRQLVIRENGLVEAIGEPVTTCPNRFLENDFKVMCDWEGPGIPFPNVQRRPDFRSSGPKRLIPQTQISLIA